MNRVDLTSAAAAGRKIGTSPEAVFRELVFVSLANVIVGSSEEVEIWPQTNWFLCLSLR